MYTQQLKPNPELENPPHCQCQSNKAAVARSGTNDIHKSVTTSTQQANKFHTLSIHQWFLECLPETHSKEDHRSNCI